MNDQDQSKTEGGGAVVLQRLVSRMPHCHDCKKVLWPWQKRGMDESSHRNCHRKRCRDLILEMPDMKREIEKEIRDCEAFYAKYG